MYSQLAFNPAFQFVFLRRTVFLAILMTLFSLSANGQDPALHVRSDGNVGINNSNPAFPFTVSVNSDAGGVNSIILENVGTSGAGAKFFQKIETGGYGQLFVRDAFNADRIFLNSGANSFMMSALTIGTAINPGYNFHVEGTASKTGGGPFASASDKRLKKNIQDYTDGLTEVLRIRPVTFQYNGKAGIKSGETYVGIVAQEIQKIAPYMISEFSPTEVIIEDDSTADPTASSVQSSEKYLQYDGTALIYMLVNAIKEQQEIIHSKESRIVDLEEKVDHLTVQFEEFTQRILNIELAGDQGTAILYQNIPNPFDNSTGISYVIPEGASNAAIHFYNMNGRLLRKVAIKQPGHGQIQIDSEDLSSGIYSYQLVIDGQLVDSKKMSKIR